MDGLAITALLDADLQEVALLADVHAVVAVLDGDDLRIADGLQLLPHLPEVVDVQVAPVAAEVDPALGSDEVGRRLQGRFDGGQRQVHMHARPLLQLLDADVKPGGPAARRCRGDAGRRERGRQGQDGDGTCVHRRTSHVPVTRGRQERFCLFRLGREHGRVQAVGRGVWSAGSSARPGNRPAMAKLTMARPSMTPKTGSRERAIAWRTASGVIPGGRAAS